MKDSFWHGDGSCDLRANLSAKWKCNLITLPPPVSIPSGMHSPTASTGFIHSINIPPDFFLVPRCDHSASAQTPCYLSALCWNRVCSSNLLTGEIDKWTGHANFQYFTRLCFFFFVFLISSPVTFLSIILGFRLFNFITLKKSLLCNFPMDRF